MRAAVLDDAPGRSHLEGTRSARRSIDPRRTETRSSWTPARRVSRRAARGPANARFTIVDLATSKCPSPARQTVARRGREAPSQLCGVSLPHLPLDACTPRATVRESRRAPSRSRSSGIHDGCSPTTDAHRRRSRNTRRGLARRHGVREGCARAPSCRGGIDVQRRKAGHHGHAAFV